MWLSIPVLGCGLVFEGWLESADEDAGMKLDGYVENWLR